MSLNSMNLYFTYFKIRTLKMASTCSMALILASSTQVVEAYIRSGIPDFSTTVNGKFFDSFYQI